MNKLLAERLAALIRLRTVSCADYSQVDLNEFTEFSTYLAVNYPELMRKTTVLRNDDWGILLRIQGVDSKKPAALFLAHYDVVPTGDEKFWKHQPFSGEIAEDCVWGRGALDDKGYLVTLLSAAEQLLQTGYQPQRDVYLSLGGDEEVGGAQGQGRTATWFRENNIDIEVIYDEGAGVVSGLIALIREPIALIGVAEKGHVNVEMSASGTPGHSSTPPQCTATDILARAVLRVSNSHFPVVWTSTVKHFFRALAPHCGFAMKMVFGNLWLTRKLVARILMKNPKTAALLVTTKTTTMLSGSDKENVIPGKAVANINVRIIPGETIEMVLARLKSVVADERISITANDKSGVYDEASVETPVDGAWYSSLKKVVAQVFPAAITAPFLMIGGTDCVRYKGMCDNIFRFSPFEMDESLLEGVHGYNERVPLLSLEKACQYFQELFAAL